ncbi:pentapeptide repeat-containing protein [Streptomyces sp. NPDC085524]|uniref:pentapeptide repeat-containing protein n=1 Tax=Streptomyces sp. NPDC085524 TaxID=3365728 RepID=UPI0037D5D1D9
MGTPPHPTPEAPSWPYCAHGADPATDLLGCRGIHVPGHTACFAHIVDTGRDAYLDHLAPGSPIDHRGTPFTEPLLNALLNALRDPGTGSPRLGHATFESASFEDAALFESVTFEDCALFGSAIFEGRAEFGSATFKGDHALFGSATFKGDANFESATFEEGAKFDRTIFKGSALFSQATFEVGLGFGSVTFESATFEGRAEFGLTTFEGIAGFGSATFEDGAGFFMAAFKDIASFVSTTFKGDALFKGVAFKGHAWFGSATFKGDVSFEEAAFARAAELGPLVCDGAVMLCGAVFSSPVTLELAAHRLECRRTRWESTATLRLRYATVDLSHAVLSSPVAVTAHPTPFTDGGAPLGESLLDDRPSRVRIASLQGVDAAHLILTDTDLSDCLFSGAFHLDQLRLEGRCTFAPSPTGLHRRRIWPYRWTRRRTLAEEHHWRAQTAGQPAPAPDHTPSPRLWRTGPHHPDPALTPDPEDVAAVYRQLRKAFEDGKNEPGAADFYYGEMEMRRHDRTSTPPGERGLLRGYWLLSGYGLRSSRAFAWLLAAMSLTVLLLMGFGLPTHDPDPATTGTLTNGSIALKTKAPDPALTGGWHQRMTWNRAGKATRVAVNSVVFRSAGQNLTTSGTVIEMASRLLEPTLLALAVLAIRGRIKR